MRIVPLLICLFASMNVFAVEPVDEQQIMFYYQIPLGADKQHSKHQFGLRFDQTSHDPRQDVRINSLISKPASMDFRMGYDGVQSINIHGVDYAKYLIAKVAEGEDAPVEAADKAATDESMGDEGDAAAKGKETAKTSETTREEEPGPLSKKINDLPVGVGIGVIVGLLILAGAG